MYDKDENEKGKGRGFGLGKRVEGWKGEFHLFF